MRTIDLRLIEACQNGDALTVKQLLQQGANPNAQGDDGKTPIIIATEYGQLEIITTLIQYGANPHFQNDFGETALHHAVENLRYEAAEYLLTKLQLDPNASSRIGVTPTMLAAKNGDLSMLKLLIHHGANPCAIDSFGCSAIHYALTSEHYPVVRYLHRNFHLSIDSKRLSMHVLPAAAKGSIHAIQCLIDLGANPHITDQHGETALHYAVKNLRYETVEYLITTLQLDPNTKDRHGITPLMIAAEKGDIHMLKLLVQHGANPHATDFEGETALHYAVRNKNYDAAQYLLTQLQINPNIQDSHGITPFMIAVQNGDIHMLQLLVQHGADPHATNPKGQTAIHYAVRNKNYDAAQYLLTQLQLNPNAQDIHGITPFLIAAQNGDIHILKLLVQHGADPHATDRDGKTALHYALENRNPAVAQYLITELKLDPNTPDRHGVTPFMIATQNGDIHILKLLIQHGADPYIRDCLGQSNLHYAIEYQNHDTAQYLLTQLQLDPNIQDQWGRTPFLIAAQNSDIHMLQLLIQHGANPYATDAKGRTAIHYAVEKHRYDIFEYLITYLHLDPNAQDHQGNTPLLIALQNGRDGIAKTLIQLGANLHIPNHQGKTPSSIFCLYRIQLKKPQPSPITL